MTATSAETFAVTISGQYVRDEIPYRCRKPRPVAHEASTTVHVPVITAEQAPVAFRVQNRGTIHEIRTHGGQLYALCTDGRGVAVGEAITPGGDHFPAEVTLRPYQLSGHPDSEETFDAAVRNRYGGYLVIDGQVWCRTGEPRYFVTTFGMGGNHSSTALMTQNSDPTAANTSIFRADDFEAAAAHARDVALRRGDTDSVSRFTQSIEVVIPSAVTLEAIAAPPREVEDLRYDYRCAVRQLETDCQDPDREASAFGKVAELRAAILNLGWEVAAPTRRPEEGRHRLSVTPGP